MELSGRRISDHHFSRAGRGYNRREVDAFLENCGATVGTLEERLKIAESRAARSEKELADLRNKFDTQLAEADDARRRIIEEAKAEARSIVERADGPNASTDTADAAVQAAAIVSEAETTASLRLKAVEQAEVVAHQRAANIVKRAENDAAVTRAEADRVLDKARLEAHATREEAESLRSLIEAEIKEIRRVAEASNPTGRRMSDPASGSDDALTEENVIIDLRDSTQEPSTRDSSGHLSGQS